MPHPLFLQDPTPARLAGLGPFLREYWPVLLPPLLGLVAVYALLPRARRSQPLVGAVLGALAVVLAGFLLVHLETVWPEALLFYTFAGIAVVGAGLMVTQHNPVYAALSFALVVLSTCGLFLLQGAPFLMAATIIIYAGAIVVTFLFVIMLAQQEGYSNADLRSREPFLSTLAGFVLMAAILCVLYRSANTHEIDGLIGQLRGLSQAQTEADVNRNLTDADVVEQENGRRRLALVERVQRYLPADSPHAVTAADLEADWNGKRYEMLRKHAGMLVEPLEARRADLGRLTAADGTVPGKANTPGRLPHRNVAAIGQALFTDYLIPVELAAVLLLVATIGAIAVAGRRGEELR